MVGPVKGLESLVVVVLGVAAVLVVLAVILTVSQVREVERAFVDAGPRAADLQLPGLTPGRAVEGVCFVLIHLEVSSVWCA